MKRTGDKLALGAKIAPAVGLLLFGERVLAQADQPDADDEDIVAIPEPGTLGLVAIGLAATGIAHAVKNRRKK